jgi:signal transduction histidine kinase
VNVLAKRAFGYAVSVGSLMLFILLIGYLNTSLVTSFPGFPIWLIPLLSAVIAIGAGATVWKKVQEMEYLKYQFVDVVTHKFRTPLTHIGWSIDTLKTSAKTAEDKEAVEAIKSANDKLFELTNTLLGMSAAESSQYLYNFNSLNVEDLIHTTHESILDRAKAKHMNIKLEIPQHMPKIWADINRFQFVLQTVFDNAVSYSPDGSVVVISASKNNGFVWIKVQDHGIGIDMKDIPHMFTKFFRTDKAKRTDTEGMGVGLYLSKEIMHRLGGEIFVKSEGLGHGSTFTVKVPIDHSGQ